MRPGELGESASVEVSTASRRRRPKRRRRCAVRVRSSQAVASCRKRVVARRRAVGTSPTTRHRARDRRGRRNVRSSQRPHERLVVHGGEQQRVIGSINAESGAGAARVMRRLALSRACYDDIGVEDAALTARTDAAAPRCRGSIESARRRRTGLTRGCAEPLDDNPTAPSASIRTRRRLQAMLRSRRSTGSVTWCLQEIRACLTVA